MLLKSWEVQDAYLGFIQMANLSHMETDICNPEHINCSRFSGKYKAEGLVNRNHLKGITLMKFRKNSMYGMNQP